MPVDLMSPTNERRAVETVKEAIKLFRKEASITPSQAIIKAAQGQDYTPETLSRLVEAYNSSAQLAHLEAADITKRADTIPLADAAEVIEAFFPEKVQTETEKAASTVVLSDYDRRETGNFMAVGGGMEKAASETKKAMIPLSTDKVNMGGMFNKIRMNKAAAERRAGILKTEAQEMLDKVASAGDELIQYFRIVGCVPFDQFEKRATAAFGKTVKPLMDFVYEEGGLARLGMKRASTSDKDVAFINEAEQPYSLVKKALDCRERYAERVKEAAETLDSGDAQFTTDMKTFRELEKPAAVEDAYNPFADVSGTMATGMSQLAGPIGTETRGLATYLRDVVPLPEPSRSVMVTEADPEHEARLAAIEQQAVLNDLINNDPVIGAVDPEHVTAAFNRISQVAPRVARNPVMLRSVMRRYVQQDDVDPFELKSLIELDSSLGQQQTAGRAVV